MKLKIFTCLLAGLPCLAPAQSALQNTTEWLRALSSEAAFDLTDDDPFTRPRLITERLDDGRTWLEFAVDTLGSAAGGDPANPAAANEWARIDEAVTLLLTEAEKLKVEAALRQGTPGEADFNLARQKYLEGAARLMAFYKQAAAGRFDGTAGLLNPAALPDWEMPGNIQLHDISGAGRLNVQTGEFSGRLSGNMEIPAFGSRLVVPSLSFDSHGNFDLTAFGTAELPPGDPRGLTLTIPARRPLTVHFAGDGDFRIAGGVQLDLPGGIRLDAFFDVDDPRYEFGLGFSGGVTLKLAKEITLVRPAVNFNAAAPLTVEALDGFGQFFGSLGKGMEGFLVNVPELPDPHRFDVGRAPDFEVPESVIPFDSMDAWLTMVGNDVVRPAVNGSINLTLEPARAIVSGMRSEVAAVQTALQPALPQIHELARLVELNARARRKLEKAAAQQILGADGPDSLSDIAATADSAAAKSKAWLQNLPADVDLKTALAVLKVYISSAAEALSMGSLTDVDFALANSRVTSFRTRLLADFGFNAAGGIGNAARVAALSAADLRLLTLSVLELNALQDQVGSSTGGEPLKGVARVLFERLRDLYLAAVTRGDLEQRAVMAVRLLDLASDQENIGFTAGDAELLFMSGAWQETLAAIASRGSGGEAGQRLAASFLDAAREFVNVENRGVSSRRIELFGEEPRKKQDEGLGVAERSFLEHVRDSMHVLEGRGLLTAVVLSGYRISLSAYLDNARAAIASNFPDTASVERNLEDAGRTLAALTDMLVFLDDLVPDNVQLIGRMQATWQAHHVKWTGVAEARKAHWYLAAYTRELATAASRYGDGAGAALSLALRTAGTEAMAGLSRTVNAMAALLNTVSLESFAFPLPGNLKIDAAHGRLAFNRLTGDWEAGFGAKLRFPDTGFTLDVRSATLAKNGNFSLNLGTGGSVPLGGSSKFTYQVADFTASGNTAQRLQFSGSGTLSYDGSAAAGDEFSAGLGVGFDSQTGVVNLSTNLNNSPLRFAEDLVLLQGAAGLTFGTQSPEGSLTVSGKLGLLARSKPLPAAGLTAQNFWLTIDALPTTFRFTDTDVKAEFTGGSITLPPDLFSSTAQPGSPPVTVAITGRLCLRYIFATRQIEFCSDPGQPYTLALSNLRLGLPELPGFQMLINSATFELDGTRFPLLKNLTAGLTLPLPGADAANPALNRSGTIAITAQNWRIDGLPEAASIGISQDLRLADFSGFTFDLLAGSALSMARTSPGVTSFTLGGSMRGGFDDRILRRDADGTAVRLTGGGTFSWNMQSPPLFSLNTVTLEGDFRLGSEGPRITGVDSGQLARIELGGLQNVFRQSPATPFAIGLNGAVEFPGLVKFGLVNSRFVMDGAGLRFEPGGVQTELGTQTLDAVKEVMPVYLSKAGLRFRSPLPLLPPAGQPGLFSLSNLQLIISGGVSIPNGAALGAGSPGLSGSVEDLLVDFVRETNGSLSVKPSINSFALMLQNVDIPPMGGLTGGLVVSGLQDPANLIFAGKVGGKVNDLGAEISMAIKPGQIGQVGNGGNPLGLLGACFSLDAGPAGIPIDGGTLGGILLTGGSGGLSFGNTFRDPCDFLAYVSNPAIPPTGAPPPLQLPPVPPGTAPGANSCLLGQFPPQTINPLCEVHPLVPGRIIYKGTALSEPQLNSLGLTRAALPASLNAAVAFAVQKIAQPARNVVTAIAAGIPGSVDANARSYWLELLNRQIRSLENTATNVISGTLGAALHQNPGANLYDAVVAAAAQGIPCLDATLKLQGNFSHAAVSTVLKGEGSVTLSTTGTAMLQGGIKLIGIPVGEGTLAYSLTDSAGDINPSFGGVLHAGVGPLTLGDMSMAYQCDGCFTAVLDSFTAFLAQNVQGMSGPVREFLVTMMNRVVPETPARPPGGDPGAFFVELTDREKLAYIGSLFNVIEVLGSGQALPPGVSAQVAGNFLTSFQLFVSEVLTRVNPRLCFQAKVRPELFGFPLIPGPTPLDARFAYERVRDNTLNQDFQQLSASATFSPAFVMASLTTGQLALLMPGTDQANLGFSFRVPAFNPATVDLALRNPVQFAQNQMTSLVQDSTLTFGYGFLPLGIPLAEGQARVVMPRLASHPSRTDRVRGFWEAPAPAPYTPPSGPGIATREQIILAALVRARLQDPGWRGQTGELDDLFAFETPPVQGTVERRIFDIGQSLNAGSMAQLGFAEHYFPHGGIIGAAQLQMPKVIAEAPPFELIGRVLDTQNQNWLADTKALFDTYLTQNAAVGQMACYIPAPNVPQGFDFVNSSPDDLLKSVSQLDFMQIARRTAPAGLYPFEQVFLSGWMKAQILGLELGEASVCYNCDPQNQGVFNVHAGIPQTSWLQQFLGASLDLTIRQPAMLDRTVPPDATLEQIVASTPAGAAAERFTAHRANLNGNVSEALIATTTDLIADTLPKVQAEAAASFQIPQELTGIMKANSAVTFFAFSPAFDRNFGLNGPGAADDDFSPYAVAHRRGGAGFKASFDLGLFPGGNPNDPNAFRISVPNASFAAGGPLPGSTFPTLTGELAVNQITLPGALPDFDNGCLLFSNAPDPGAPYLEIEALTDPLSLKLSPPFVAAPVTFAEIRPLRPRPTAQNPNPLLPARIGGRFAVTRNLSGNGAALSLGLRASALSVPFLGPNVTMVMYGEERPDGTFSDFSFATQPGQAWNASVCIFARDAATGEPVYGRGPGFALCDPRTPGQGPCLLSFTPLDGLDADAFPDVLCARASGTGMESFALEIDIPLGFTATFFPGQSTEVTRTIGGTGNGKLFIERLTDGTCRFYLDCGPQNNIGLPGVLTANGRLEFGFNPTAVAGSVTVAPSTTTSFGSVEACTTATSRKSFTVTNASGESQGFVVHASPETDWLVTQPGFTLAAGASRTVDVIFQPQQVGNLSGFLHVEADDFSITRNLTGTGTGQPRYFQSTGVLAFPDTLTGGQSRSTVTIGNSGCANLVITSLGVSPAGVFAASVDGSPAFPLTIPRGASRQITVTYSPAGALTSAATLSINTANGGVDAAGKPNGTARTYTAALSGTGTENRWLEILDSATTGTSATFNDVLMLDSLRGWIAGGVPEGELFQPGSFLSRSSAAKSATLETKDGGRSWTPRVLTPYNIHRMTAVAVLSQPSTLELHFEEPPGARVFRDETAGGRNAAAVGSLSNNFSSGRFGAGIDFSGSGTGLEVPAFNPAASFTVAAWISPDSTGNSVFIGKTSTSGVARQFSLGTSSAGTAFEIIKDGVSVTGGTPAVSVYQHVAAVVSGNSVKLYINGSLTLDTTAGAGAHAAWSGGNPWTVGHDFSSLNVRTRFFNGRMDEIYFFDAALDAAEISKLANTGGGLRLLMAGDEGTVLESETRGRTWHLTFDQNVSGWRHADRVFRDYDWHAVSPALSSGKLLLAGSQPGGTVFNPANIRTLMLEDLFTGAAGTADDRYDDVTFNASAGTGGNETLFDVIADNGFREFAFSSTGVIYKSPGGAQAGLWERHGTLDLAGALRDAEAVANGIQESYIAVGDAGSIVRSVDGADPLSVTAPAGVTASLRQVDWTGSVSAANPELHIIGDADPATGKATYLSSADLGASWSLVDDGLRGSWNGIDVRDGTSASGYESWVVGASSRAAYRPKTVPNTGFLTFFPGELNFGFLQRGITKTLPLRLTNRGRRSLTIQSVSLTGPDFELAQSLAVGVARLEPGDSVSIQVRYRPDAASSADQGEVIIAALEGAVSRTFRAPLSGRCDDQSWRPVPLSSGGLPLTGTVVDVHFFNATSPLLPVTGYALTDDVTGSKLYRSTDSGVTWTQVTLAAPPAGQIHRFKGMDWHERTVSTTDDLGMLAGEARDAATGSLINGVILRTLNSGTAWAVRSPAVTSFGFRDVDILDSNAGTATCVSGTEATLVLAGQPTGDVYVTTNATVTTPVWAPKSSQPSSSFRGKFVHMAIVPTFDPVIMALSSTQLFAQDISSAWPGTPSFQGQQSLNAVLFRNLTSGVNTLEYGWIVGQSGLFWRWERSGSELTPFENDSLWTPAANQEIFGTTHLTGVSFDEDKPAGFICGGSRIFYSTDRGRSWDIDFDAGAEASLRSIHTEQSPSTTTLINGQTITIPGRLNAWSGGSLSGSAVVWRLAGGNAAPGGVLSASDVELWDPVPPGTPPVIRTVALRNLGTAALPVHSVTVNDEDAFSRFRIVNSPPASIAAGGSFDLQVEFNPAADPVDVPALQPKGFYRFEQPADAVSFTDSSVTARPFTAAAAPANPVIFRDEGQRSSALRFDGGDYAEMSGGPEVFAGDFSFSIWINPSTTNDGQVFFSKHSATGANRFLCQFLNNGYHFRLVGTSFNTGAGLKKTGWQHLAVTGRKSGANTDIVFWRDGEILGTTTLTAVTAGNFTGLPWLLGAERDGATVADINEFFSGSLDDFGIWDRVLTDGEIQALSSRSPACGAHAAQLVVAAGGDSAKRTVDLRAEINETTGFYVIDTVPSGQPVFVDGQEILTPATFAVRCVSRNPSEWLEGSLHTVSVKNAAFTVDAGGDLLTYRFAGWDTGGGPAVTIAAAAGDALLAGRYVRSDLQPPAGAQIAGRAVRDIPAGIIARIAGTPQGPWLRLSGGNVSLPSLAPGGFAISGDLFLSLTRIKGSLSSDAITFPQGSPNPLVEMGAADWRVDFRAGGNGKLNLYAHPPAVKAMGFDLVPDGEVCIQSDFDTDTFRFDLRLMQDFQPVPGFFEVRRVAGGGAGLKFERLPDAGFRIAMDGRIRMLRVTDHPNPDSEVWAVDAAGSFAAATPGADFSLSLRQMLGASLPNTLFASGPFTMAGGDLLLRRIPAGLELGVQSPDFRFNGTSLAQVNGAVSTSGKLKLSGTTATGTLTVPLMTGNSSFGLKTRDGNPFSFDFEILTQTDPGFRLKLPAMKVFMDLPANVDDLTLNTPEINFDSTGAFDTGKMNLPAFDFDGVPVSNQTGGGKPDNYIRLRRTAAGRVSFTANAVLEPFNGCVGDFSLAVERPASGSLTVDASMTSNFCVLPFTLSLGYDSARASCQFFFQADGWRVLFGKDPAGGLCAEVWGGVADDGSGGVRLLP